MTKRLNPSEKRPDTLEGAAQEGTTTRRDIMKAAGTLTALAGAAGGLIAAPRAAAQQAPPASAQTTATDFPDNALSRPFRTEVDIFDCEVEGKIPDGFEGTFYRVGPDPQYPLKAGNIAFDGEGMVGAFRFKNGKVSFKSRYVKNQRWKAQAEAGERLFGMYRNPFDVDPRAKGVSPGTANTHIIVHRGKLFALKEDSPPVAMDPLTLDTTDDYHLFGDTYKGPAFSAHPKIDSESGEMWTFGYEAKGLATTDIYVAKIGLDGKVNWDAWVRQPYPAMIHDFAVTERHIGFFVCPLAVDVEQMRKGGVRFSYDSARPSYLGVMRRDGDGKDIMWLEGPERMSTHTMGCFSDGNTFYYDMDMGTSNQFPFFPNVHGERFNPVTAGGYVSRMKVDFSNKTPRPYDIETMYPEIAAYLPRQDDRYTTLPYRYGFMPWTDRSRPDGGAWVRFDHSDRSTQAHYVGPASQQQEMCFVPRSADAPEGDGYIVGVVHRLEERRTDLLIVDTEDFTGPPVAVVKLPFQIWGQVHGLWTPKADIPGWDLA
jgi:carotenoid cleavage dioxygenase